MTKIIKFHHHKVVKSYYEDIEFEDTLKKLLTDMVNKIEDKSLDDGTYTIKRNQKGKEDIKLKIL